MISSHFIAILLIILIIPSVYSFTNDTTSVADFNLTTLKPESKFDAFEIVDELQYSEDEEEEEEDDELEVVVEKGNISNADNFKPLLLPFASFAYDVIRLITAGVIQIRFGNFLLNVQ